MFVDVPAGIEVGTLFYTLHAVAAVPICKDVYIVPKTLPLLCSGSV